MSFFDNAKRAIMQAYGSVRNALKSTRTPSIPVDPHAPPKPADTTSYLWVSKPIPEDVTLAYHLGLPRAAAALWRDAPKGRTLDAGINQLKRDADATGQNNKARRRNRSALRAAMLAHKQACIEMRA